MEVVVLPFDTPFTSPEEPMESTATTASSKSSLGQLSPDFYFNGNVYMTGIAFYANSIVVSEEANFSSLNLGSNPIGQNEEGVEKFAQLIFATSDAIVSGVDHEWGNCDWNWKSPINIVGHSGSNSKIDLSLVRLSVTINDAHLSSVNPIVGQEPAKKSAPKSFGSISPDPQQPFIIRWYSGAHAVVSSMETFEAALDIDWKDKTDIPGKNSWYTLLALSPTQQPLTSPVRPTRYVYNSPYQFFAAEATTTTRILMFGMNGSSYLPSTPYSPL